MPERPGAGPRQRGRAHRGRHRADRAGRGAGKSGARLERVVIAGQPYVLKHLDLAEDWTMRASGCLRGAPLLAWERGHAGPAARVLQPADRRGRPEHGTARRRRAAVRC